MENESPENTPEVAASQSPERSRAVRIEELGELVRAKRLTEKMTLEQVARQTGVSAATLSRCERLSEYVRANAGDGARRRYPEPDTRTIAALARWLGVALERVMDVPPPPTVQGITHREGDTVPDMVEAHLRADQHLNSETAAALSRMFRLAYEQFARLSTPSAQPAADQHDSAD